MNFKVENTLISLVSQNTNIVLFRGFLTGTYFDYGLLYFFLRSSWKLACPGKWQHFHGVEHGLRQQNLALILELSKLLKQESNQMPNLLLKLKLNLFWGSGMFG